MFRFFYSDPHFNHAKIIEHAKRPFGSIEEMNETLVQRYNETVGRDDCVLWLGDVFLGPFEEAQRLLRRLNGFKFLIIGNHDRSTKRMAEMGFSAVATEMTLKLFSWTVRVSHYPYANSGTWGHERKERHVREYGDKYPVRRKGEFLMHGHTHGRKKYRDRMIHVGVDAWDYRPVTLDEIGELLASKGG